MINSDNSYITLRHLLFGPDRRSLGTNLAHPCSTPNSAMCENPFNLLCNLNPLYLNLSWKLSCVDSVNTLDPLFHVLSDNFHKIYVSHLSQ